MELTSLQKYDTQGMYKVYERWPEIAQQYFKNDSQNVDFGNISHVVFAGMGGSGAIGDIFSSILSKTDIHVDVIKGYLLPKTVNKNSLVVATSISGNTEETLAILRKAYELKCKIVAFSDGGKMQQYCIKNQINYKQICMNHSPRASFPAFLYSILNVLQPFLPIEKNDIQDSLNSLKKQREQITSNNLTLTNPALELAKWLNDVPLIYYPWGLQASAIRFKNSLQENAKMHAITEDVIEACHNGIVSWEKNSQIKPILIQGNDDYIKTKERWKILREFFEDRKIEYKEIKSVDGGIFSKLINLIYLLDYSTIYRASLSKIDPTPVKSIDFVKKRLS